MQKLNVNSVISMPTTSYPQRSFKIVKCLGEGAQGIVYLACQQNGDPTIVNVALKFQPQISEEERVFLTNLINYQNKYDSPGAVQKFPTYIIRVYEIIMQENSIVIIMEIGNTCMIDYLKGNLKLEEKQETCLQILKSIQMLHYFGYTHRDIKPENFIRVGNVWKLCDFGLVKSSLLLATKMIGTIYYMAPEILNDNQIKYTEKADIWSLGCMFYEVITGKELFEGNYAQYKREYSRINKIKYLNGQFGYRLTKIVYIEKNRGNRNIISLERNNYQNAPAGSVQALDSFTNNEFYSWSNNSPDPSSIIKQLPQNFQVQRFQPEHIQIPQNQGQINNQQINNINKEKIMNPVENNIRIETPQKFQPLQFQEQLNNQKHMNQQVVLQQQFTPINNQQIGTLQGQRFTPIKQNENNEIKRLEQQMTEMNKEVKELKQQMQDMRIAQQNSMMIMSLSVFEQQLNFLSQQNINIDNFQQDQQNQFNILYAKLTSFLKKN